MIAVSILIVVLVDHVGSAVLIGVIIIVFNSHDLRCGVVYCLFDL